MILISFLFVFASSAGATVYKWTDERGVVNFADDADKIPAAYRDSAEEVKVPKMAAQAAQTPKTPIKPPPISQVLVREGDLAIKLVEAFRMGQAQSEAEAESMLATAGVAPKNGWIADYPVTPDVVGELQNAVAEAAGSGKLTVSKDEAAKVFQDIVAQQGLPVSGEGETQYAGAGEAGAGAEASPPQDYPEYYEPSVVNNYYSDQGPPIVTYYPPPPDYGYLYAWVPYPFWFGGFWFPGFFCLHDFHRVVFVHGHRRFVSNHFWDSGTRTVGRIDPGRRHMGNSMANTPQPRRFTGRETGSGASSIPRRVDRPAANHPGGTPGGRTGSSQPNRNFTGPAPTHHPGGVSGNRTGSSQPNFRDRPDGIRPPTGYRPPSGYSPGARVPSRSPAYKSSFGSSGSFSRPGPGIGRSFTPPSGSGGSGFFGGGFGSRGFSGGGRSFGGGSRGSRN